MKKRAKRYSRSASREVEQAMHERKEGTLTSGGSGEKVRSKKQAIAIGLAKARKKGARVPRTRVPRKRTTSKSPTKSKR